jgi:hypothetical protein
VCVCVCVCVCVIVLHILRIVMIVHKVNNIEGQIRCCIFYFHFRNKITAPLQVSAIKAVYYYYYYYYSNALLTWISTWSNGRLYGVGSTVVECVCIYCMTLTSAVEVIFAWKFYSFFFSRQWQCEKFISAQLKHRQQNALKHKFPNRLNTDSLGEQSRLTNMAARTVFTSCVEL